MNKDEIVEYFCIMNMFQVSLYALKWLVCNNDSNYESLIVQNEYIMKKLQKFCINSIGFPDE